MQKKLLALILIWSMLGLSNGGAQMNYKTVSYDQSYTPQNKEWGRILCLDGKWQIVEGNKNQMPSQFSATVSCTWFNYFLATPAFNNAGEEKPEN